MKGKTHILISSVLVMILSVNAGALNSWQAPFDTSAVKSGSVDSLLSLNDVLKLVATENQIFRSSQDSGPTRNWARNSKRLAGILRDLRNLNLASRWPRSSSFSDSEGRGEISLNQELKRPSCG